MMVQRYEWESNNQNYIILIFNKLVVWREKVVKMFYQGTKTIFRVLNNIIIPAFYILLRK